MDSEHSLPWRQMLAEPQEMILMQKAVGTEGYKVNYGERLLPHGVFTTRDDVWYLRGRKSNTNDSLAEPVIAGPVTRKPGHATGRCCADILELNTTTLSSRTTDTTLP